MATIGLAVAGGGAGYVLGGTQGALLGYGAASIAGGLFFGPKPEQRYGPRIEDQAVSNATEGADIPIVWGRKRTAGQVIWQGQRNEHEHEDEGGGKGGPSTTQITYTYTRSFAVDFGKFESQAILRIWFNKELVVDVRPEAQGSRRAGLKFTVYLGTETQEPDPLMEAVMGVGNLSAHRGHTYIVFDEVDVTDTDGRPPSVEAEVLTAATSNPQSLSFDVHSSKSESSVMHWDAYNQRLYAAFVGSASNYSVVAVVDPQARRIIKVLELTQGNRCHCLPYTSLYALEYNGGRNDRLFAYGKERATVYDAASLKPLGSFDPGNVALDWAVETKTMLAFEYGNVFRAWSKAESPLNPISETFITQTLPTGYTDRDAQIGFVEESYLIKVLRNDTTGQFTGCRYFPSTLGGSWDELHAWGKLDADYEGIRAMVEDTLNGCVWAMLRKSGGNQYLFKLSRRGEFLAEVDLGSGPPASSYVDGSYPMFFDAVTHSLYLHLDTATLYIYDVIAGVLTSKTIVHGSNWTIYLATLHEVWCGSHNDNGRAVLYADQIDRITANKITATEPITDICALAGIDAAALNLSQVTHQIDSYWHTRRVPAWADLEPLLAALHLDVVASDYQLKFVPRGGAAVATLDADWLGAHEPGDTPPPVVRPVYAQGIDRARSLDLHYVSIEADLQPASARAEWVSGEAQREDTLTLPMVLGDAEAAVLVDQRLQLGVEKDRYHSTCTRRYAHLEPTDPVNVPVGGVLVRTRILDYNRGANGINEIMAEIDDPEDLVSYAVSGAGGVTARDILLLSPPQLIVLDGPLLRDVDLDHPGPYLAGFTYSAGYPGAVVFMAPDGASYGQVATLLSEAVIGQIATVPARVALDAWDDTNTLAATMINGTLTSKTDAEILAGANALLWGVPGRWEVIQPGTCTVTGADTLDLSHILRGRRGTDWAMELHQADDWLVAADAQTLARITLANADIGAQRWFKLPAVGTPAVDANASVATVGKQPLMPYSPIEVDAVFDASGATLSWLRRTRKGGFYGGANNLVDGVGGVLSEDTESWEVDIATVQAPETVLRTLSATTASVLYALADMTTDGIPANGPFHATTHQLSAAVGRGHGRQAILAKTFHDLISGGSPVAYWRLDETTGILAYDAVGSHDGTISGTVTLGQPGLVASGTCFSVGATGKVLTATSANFKLGNEWTVLCWVRAPTPGTTPKILTILNPTFLLWIGFTATNVVEGYARDNVGVLQGPVSSAPLTGGNVYSIVLTYDNAQMRLYIDGVLVDSLAFVGTTWGGGNPQVRLTNDGGDIDEAAVYTRCLSPLEIEAILGLA